MQPQQSSRIDLGDLKAQIIKKLGGDRSKWYFSYLNRLLSQNLSKNKFDKLSLRVLGKENLQLHNRFVRSILKNASQAKSPPSLHLSTYSKSTVQSSSSSPGKQADYQLSGPGFSNHRHRVRIWSNGVLPVSLQSGKSEISDMELKDRPSPLGPNAKVITNNGDATLCDCQRPVQKLEAVAELPDSTINEDMNEYERSNPLQFYRNHLLAPLGIPFCSATVGGAQKGMPLSGRLDSVSYYNNSELADTEMLRRRMDQIVRAQGLEGVSIECANVLNNMLNLYVKRMICSCIELVESRSIHEIKRYSALKPHMQGKVMNGTLPSDDLIMQSSSPIDIKWEQRPRSLVSLLDFKIAMELNPKQLGEDWPVMLEKICMISFEE